MTIFLVIFYRKYIPQPRKKNLLVSDQIYWSKFCYLLVRLIRSVTCMGTGLISQGSWVRYPVWQHTFVSPSAFSRRAVVSYWRKYVHEVLVNRLGGLSLPRKSVIRLIDRPDMTLDVYRGCKNTIQQQRHFNFTG